MPFKSQKQAKLFYAAAHGGLTGEGPSKEVAQKFISDTGHQKVGKLPEYSHKFNKLKKAMK